MHCCNILRPSDSTGLRFLGLDARSREILSYISGTPVLPPYPDWALTDEALTSVAILLCAYQLATCSRAQGVERLVE
jgi:hypothetical protein